MDKETFKYSLKLARDPILLINALDDMGRRVVEVWLIDREDRNNRHLVDTIAIDYNETPASSRVLQKIREYNDWFNDATGRKPSGYEI
ncbi:MAG: hypothetical protein ABL876_07940 [Chitinophagaceae bacterium]